MPTNDSRYTHGLRKNPRMPAEKSHTGPGALGFSLSFLDTVGRGGGRVFLTVAYSTPELRTIGFLRVHW